MKKLIDSALQSPGPANKQDALKLYLRGLIMGLADLIPGVSGGTIAFITGIYENFLEALGSVNKETLSLLLKFKFSEAISKIHTKFLVILFSGIFTSIFLFARLMHFLMNNHPIHTWSLFFGLIAASIVVVFREMDEKTKLPQVISLIGGTIFAYLMVSLIPVTTPEASWFIFICGMISISAMILPGLSGSFLLLILGKYAYITGAVKNPFNLQNIVILLTFLGGAIVGAMGFSRILNYFLKHFRSQTMAFLTGILVGSMKKVWPWKVATETVMVRGKLRVLQEQNIVPEVLNSEVGLAIVLAFVGFCFVLVIENYSRKKSPKQSLAATH